MGLESMGDVWRALRFAASRHRDQRRKDAEASPYINHPIDVAELLWRVGEVRDPVVLMAAVLHDVVEDTEATIEEVREHFGDEVASVVAEVTDDKDLPRAERKQRQVTSAAHKSHRAKLVKLADKITNLADLLSSPPRKWDRSRQCAYAEWSAAVIAGLRGASPALEAAFDALYARCVAELGARLDPGQPFRAR